MKKIKTILYYTDEVIRKYAHQNVIIYTLFCMVFMRSGDYINI